MIFASIKNESILEVIFAVRDFLFHISALIMGFFALVLMGFNTHADLILFHNGDHHYGKVKENPDGTIQLDLTQTVKYYKKNQVKEIFYGINQPATGEVVSVTNYNEIGGTKIISVTGPITHRSIVQTSGGKLLQVDVEDGFQVPIIQLFPRKYGFYNRSGCFMAGLLINTSTQAWNALQMRVHLYDPDNRILSSKDFYIYRIPPAANNIPGQRKFEIVFADVPYDRVDRMRLVRKF